MTDDRDAYLVACKFYNSGFCKAKSGIYKGLITFERCDAICNRMHRYDKIKRKEQEERKMISLGYANGWKEEPALVKEAKEKGYRLKSEAVGMCDTRYTCEELGFYYMVDSSD